jgi:tetratricopeptide (TPR) repeat protein
MPRVKPWLVGIVGTLSGVLKINETDIPCRGRLALILLDTVFETASFVYLEKEMRWKKADLGALADRRVRSDLLSAVRRTTTLGSDVWTLLEECHTERNVRAHQDPNKDIPGSYVREYFSAALAFVNHLFKLTLDEEAVRLEGALTPSSHGHTAATNNMNEEAAERLAQATHLYYSGETNQALLVAEAIANQTGSAHARYLLSLCLWKTGPAALPRALAAMGEAVSLRPLDGEPTAHLKYATLLLRGNRAKDALRSVDRAIDLGVADIKGAEAHALQGDVLRCLCRFTQATQAYRTSLTYDPKHPRAIEGLVETLLTLDKDHDALVAVEDAISKAPKSPYFHILRARCRARTSIAEGLADLDEAWRVSTLDGGTGDNRVFLTRASLFFAQYKNSPPEGAEGQEFLEKARATVAEALVSPIVKPGFRPAFRSFRVGLLWHLDAFEDAYSEALKATKENKYQEKNFALLAMAGLATKRWAEAKTAAERGIELAGQVMVWLLWSGLFEVVASLFAGESLASLEPRALRWRAALSEVPEFSTRKLDWAKPRGRIEHYGGSLPTERRHVLTELLGALDRHPAA